MQSVANAFSACTLLIKVLDQRFRSFQSYLLRNKHRFRLVVQAMLCGNGCNAIVLRLSKRHKHPRSLATLLQGGMGG
ncbi:hypothetical protein AC249_AIPGENE7946 [Exaiptasia diaphana]|nr:hypothetical protein AC249_AIPGENE7946 [Exaiptasia diaphana]